MKVYESFEAAEAASEIERLRALVIDWNRRFLNFQGDADKQSFCRGRIEHYQNLLDRAIDTA